MLDSAQKFERAFERFEELDPHYGHDLLNSEGIPDHDDWENVRRLPILSSLARDVLAIPISTVASESVFNTGGRVLDSYRSSLTPRVVQALICAQD
nr:Uncharacterized protein TCM_004162 [Ipomoea trifida]